MLTVKPTLINFWNRFSISYSDLFLNIKYSEKWDGGQKLLGKGTVSSETQCPRALPLYPVLQDKKSRNLLFIEKIYKKEKAVKRKIAF